jgi:hypothetical protein
LLGRPSGGHISSGPDCGRAWTARVGCAFGAIPWSWRLVPQQGFGLDVQKVGRACSRMQTGKTCARRPVECVISLQQRSKSAVTEAGWSMVVEGWLSANDETRLRVCQNQTTRGLLEMLTLLDVYALLSVDIRRLCRCSGHGAVCITVRSTPMFNENWGQF